jgi:hypothetical protein
MSGTGKFMSIWRCRMKYRLCRKILTIVLLMSFWRIPVFGEQRITPLTSSEESGTRQYSESEVDALIDELTGAAHEAIEQAAAEAVKAAALASLEREAAAIREAQSQHTENSRLKQSRLKTAVVTGIVCFFGGLAIGAGTTAILTGR